jgi:hypothetical protein
MMKSQNGSMDSGESMQFNKLAINPAKNPAVLDTATWDPERAWSVIQSLSDTYWESIQQAAAQDSPLPIAADFTPSNESAATYGSSLFFLATLADGQQVFIEVGASGEAILGMPAGATTLRDGGRTAMYKTDAPIVDRFVRFVKPDAGPRSMGAVPRLGIGTRMTTAVWPGIFRAMDTCAFAANAIQNSVRELNLLDHLLTGQPADRNYAFNFGTIEAGYTGSSFEGLWLSGVLEALKSSTCPRYGADADHIQVKRGAEGLSRAKQIATATRYYTFFTLDVSDILDYGAMNVEPAGTAEAYLTDRIQDSDQYRAVLAYHGRQSGIGDRSRRLDEAMLGRLVGKYWHALNAVQVLTDHIKGLKDDIPFDLELSIDEHPPEVQTFDCLTTDVELNFLLLEIQRRELPVTHIAPNFGVQKGTDYRCPDGLEGLERRTRSLASIAQEFGVILDFHSGDDLTSSTRRVIQRATQGRLHFKISPALQLLFAVVLMDYHPKLFQSWWNDALAYARREATAGSTFAAECIRQFEKDDTRVPSPHYALFHHYSFAFVGRRDDQGQFLNREEFYSLSPAFYQEYQTRVARYLCSLAEELL